MKQLQALVNSYDVYLSQDFRICGHESFHYSAYKHLLNSWLIIILFEVKAIWCFVNDMKLELWGGLMVFFFSTYVIQQTHDFNEDRIYHSFTLLSSTVGPSRGCWFIKLIGSFNFSLYYLATFSQLFWVCGTYNVVIMKHNNHKR